MEHFLSEEQLALSSAGSPSDGAFCVVVRVAASGESLGELCLKPRDTVFELGLMVAQLLEIPCSPSLIFNDCPLVPCDTVAMSGLHADAEISVVLCPLLPPLLVTGCASGSATLWNACTGELERALIGHEDCAWAASLSPDGEHVLTGSSDCCAKIWSASSGHCLHTLWHGSRISACAFTPCGTHAGTVALDCIVRIWDVEAGDCKKLMAGHTDEVCSLAFASLQSHLAAALLPSQVSQTGSCSSEVPQCVMLTNADDGTAKIWDTRIGECVKTHHCSCADTISVSLTPTGAYLGRSPALILPDLVIMQEKAW